MSVLLTADPATLTVAAPDGTPVTAETTTGPPILGTVAGGTFTVAGAVGRIVSRVMVGDGDYFDGDTLDTAALDYAWAGEPHASTSTESNLVVDPDGIPSDVTWDGAACLGPPSNSGRWNDVAATDRWDATDPALTWNNYNGG